jgi:AcrR family transcriptional regulator
VPRRGLDTEQVVRAAVKLADQEGLDHVTLARLAGLLGVQAPSLYNHVNGRGALLRLITLRGLLDLRDAIATSAAGLSGEQALRATAHAYRAYAHAHPGCYEAILGAPSEHDPETRAAAGRLLELLGAILRGWELRGEEAIDAIRVMRSALHGFVALERSGAFALPREPDPSFERLVDMLVTGFARAGSGR